ncbi:hypothetical protein [Paenibacillus methanolicus]|uniref:DUF2140 family protein n=1 Tax=Paenibacillus methanolicus TaxID=582686 RepID=A0A5S5CJ53_9BACL|nr:hypothetical protein [Paenibacillus methanolicus]TYP79554.1 hypothetical protein BCM02_101674 [Paenibacillus methanolicus]
MRIFRLMLLAFFIVLAAAALTVYLYAAPREELDLSYQPVPLMERAVEMLRRQSLELVLTEDDLNHLAKRSLSLHPNVRPNVQVTGAAFELKGDRMIADVNAKLLGFWTVGLQAVYTFRWEAPNLIGTPIEMKAGDIALPKERIGELVIPIGEELPIIKLDEVYLKDGQIHVRIHKPSLSDLKRLL